MIEFSVIDWAAWAPGLHDKAAWRAWADAPSPQLPRGDETPALNEVPALQRRRIERLGRIALQTAYWCDQANVAGVPWIFASRHGDVARALQLLRTLAADEALSPTQFGLSVHNAIAALHSIATSGQGNYLAIAAGRSTAESACIEAAALLADGAPEVRVVCYDAPLADAYARFADEPEAWHAWCWRLAPRAAAGIPLRLAWSGEDRGSAPDRSDGSAALPHSLDVQRFLLSRERELGFDDDAQGRQWTWTRQ